MFCSCCCLITPAIEEIEVFAPLSKKSFEVDFFPQTYIKNSLISHSTQLVPNFCRYPLMSIGQLKHHALRNIWKNEATDFTAWLEENTQCLSKVLGFELNDVNREASVGAFSADLVCVDEFGNKVVIENQLEKTDHTHLGQIITYISNLDAKTVVWISSEPRLEHINAINWLNTHTQISFYLLKLEAISIDESKPAPYFQVICKPSETLRAAISSQNELSERGKFNIQFWSQMVKKCEDVLPNFTSRKPLPYSFFSGATGRAGFSFVFFANKKSYGVELYIDVNDADQNYELLKQLEKDRMQIEKEYGAALFFDEIEDKRACRIKHIIKEGMDPMSSDIDAIQKDLINHMNKLEKVFKPRIRKLDIDFKEAA